MAVTVANARGELSSRTLRGVVVFEVAKLKKSDPESTSWSRPAVQKMLTQRAIDAADLEPFNPGPKGGSKGGSNPYANPTAKGGRTDDLTPPPRVAEREAKGGSKGGPTPAPTPSSYSNSKVGYVSTEGNQGADGLPSPYCPNHPKGTNRPCTPCADAREARKAAIEQQQRAEKARRSAIFEEVRNCKLCDDHGRIETDSGLKYCDAGHPKLKDAG